MTKIDGTKLSEYKAAVEAGLARGTRGLKIFRSANGIVYSDSAVVALVDGCTAEYKADGSGYRAEVKTTDYSIAIEVKAGSLKELRLAVIAELEDEHLTQIYLSSTCDEDEAAGNTQHENTMNAINTAAKVTGEDIFMYFFGFQGMYDHYDIFAEETDWRYRKVGYDMTTPDDLEIVESMVRNGIYSLYWNHSRVCLIAEAELEKAKRIISNGERIPKCRLTVEHIEMLNVMKEQDDSVTECYKHRAGLLYMNGIIDYNRYKEIRGGIRKGAVHFSVLQPRPELEPEPIPSNIDEIEREMFDAEFIEPDV